MWGASEKRGGVLENPHPGSLGLGIKVQSRSSGWEVLVATIGLSMIVKNGGEGLRSCLESVRSLVDQIVIADTGSTDDSVAIAREFDATIVDFPWCDDYAAARNAALAPLTTEWVFSLDADEEVLPESLVEVRRLVA
jgi:hypothetical protein